MAAVARWRAVVFDCPDPVALAYRASRVITRSTRIRAERDSVGVNTFGWYSCPCSASRFSVSRVVPVDLHIRGCPPSPEALLKGLLALISDA